MICEVLMILLDLLLYKFSLNLIGQIMDGGPMAGVQCCGETELCRAERALPNPVKEERAS